MEQFKNKTKISIDLSLDTKHLNRVDTLLKNRKRGDLANAAEILGITLSNVQRALERIGSKHHLQVVEVLELIINNRIELTNHFKNTKQRTFNDN